MMCDSVAHTIVYFNHHACFSVIFHILLGYGLLCISTLICGELIHFMVII